MALVAETSPPLVTVTGTLPEPPGDVAVMEVPAELTLTPVAAAPPKSTVDPEVNPDPVMVTVVPPVAGPDNGEIAVTTGTYANCPATTGLPPVGVTVTSTVPSPAGVLAVRMVPAELTLTPVATVPPKSTVDPEVNPEPEIVTEVPPLAGPDVGEREVIVGE